MHERTSASGHEPESAKCETFIRAVHLKMCEMRNSCKFANYVLRNAKRAKESDPKNRYMIGKLLAWLLSVVASGSKFNWHLIAERCARETPVGNAILENAILGNAVFFETRFLGRDLASAI